MLVAWKDGKPKLRFSLKREFAKAMNDKEQQRLVYILSVCSFDANEFIGTDRRTYSMNLPGQPLVVSPLLFLLAIYLAAEAFKK